MKEQYIGDIKDYYKYTLIEFISEVYCNNVIYVWMLTAPDGTEQGNDITYLNDPKKYRWYNPALYDKLKNIAPNKQTKNLNVLENVLTCESQDFRQLYREMRQYAWIQ
jgi:hypothetical protein